MKNKIWLFGLVILLSLIPIAVLAQNQPPVADAGADQDLYTGDVAYMAGSAVDADGDAIILWSWTVVDSPVDGIWQLYDADKPTAQFLPRTPGAYVLSLGVVDAVGNFSAPDFGQSTPLTTSRRSRL